MKFHEDSSQRPTVCPFGSRPFSLSWYGLRLPSMISEIFFTFHLTLCQEIRIYLLLELFTESFLALDYLFPRYCLYPYFDFERSFLLEHRLASQNSCLGQRGSILYCHTSYLNIDWLAIGQHS